MNPITIIPARMAATRLPNKPLADIGGLPMIVRVLNQALKANIGPVAVAAGDPEIVAAVKLLNWMTSTKYISAMPDSSAGGWWNVAAMAGRRPPANSAAGNRGSSQSASSPSTAWTTS